MEDVGVDVMQFSACSVCGRTFRPDVLERHTRICSQVQANSRKRKAFNSSKQRVLSNDINPPFSGKGKTVPNRSSKPPPTPSRQPPTSNQEAPLPTSKSNKTGNWRQKHEEFVTTFRAAREVTRALKTGGPLPPPPPPAENPDYVQCPYCQRRFNEDAAKRHMPFCKDQSTRLRKVPTKDAVDKLTRRIQYKAPLPKSHVSSGTSINPPMSSSTVASSFSTNPSASQNPMGNGPLFPSGYKQQSQQSAARGPVHRPGVNHMTGFQTTSYLNSGPMSKAEKRPGNEVVTSINRRVRQPHRLRGSSSSESAESDTRSLQSRGSGVDSLQLNPTPPTKPREQNSQRSHQRRLIRQSTVHSSSSQAEYAHRPQTGDMAGGTIFRSKFCYECGTQYPVPHAKYCCECGAKRVS